MDEFGYLLLQGSGTSRKVKESEPTSDDVVHDLTDPVWSHSDGDGVDRGRHRRALQISAVAADEVRSEQGQRHALNVDDTPNTSNPDIDGDGVVNWLDPDDNGNAILDIFDVDANGDLVNDRAPGAGNTDPYFVEGVEYVTTRVEVAPAPEGRGRATSLVLIAKLRDGVTPRAVRIKGSRSLFGDADTMLLDDGQHEDANAGDSVFARRFELRGGRVPRANEAVFFDLEFDSGLTESYPLVFSNLSPREVTTQIGQDHRVQIAGAPFGANLNDFIWAIELFDSRGYAVWQSEAIPASNRIFPIQENVMVEGESYTFSVVALSLDKVPGYPTYIVRSLRHPVPNP